MVIAGIVAGGTGSRMGAAGNIPKQFMLIGGKPIILHTIERFVDSPDIDAVVIGVHADWEEYLENLLKDCFDNPIKPVVVIAGGSDRTDTLNRIVEGAALRWQLSDEDILVTHDAVRPFVTQEIIHENVIAAKNYGMCSTAIAATDTILHSVDSEYITDIPLRSEMYQAQTPQSFRYGIYCEVYNSLTKEEMGNLTDACGMFYRKGRKVYMVKGDVRNFKITYPQDLALAEVLIRN